MANDVTATVDGTGARTVDLRSLLKSDIVREQLEQLRRIEVPTLSEKDDRRARRD